MPAGRQMNSAQRGPPDRPGCSGSRCPARDRWTRRIQGHAVALDAPSWEGCRGAAPILAARFPHLFSPHHSARTFVLTLATIVHPELRKAHDLTDAPQFAFDATDPDVLPVGYRSPRRLCALAEGFIAGAAAHYGELAEIEHDPCMLDGAESCVFRCRLPATADRA